MFFNNLKECYLVPGTGIEPVQPFRATGFSYHYGFRHLVVCGPDYSFTIDY